MGMREDICFLLQISTVLKKKLVIELDGTFHDYQKEYDAQRDRIMGELGINVLRIKNEELNYIERVLERIKTYPSPLSL
jgi:very-short-patch-repair endonuclease